MRFGYCRTAAQLKLDPASAEDKLKHLIMRFSLPVVKGASSESEDDQRQSDSDDEYHVVASKSEPSFGVARNPAVSRVEGEGDAGEGGHHARHHTLEDDKMRDIILSAQQQSPERPTWLWLLCPCCCGDRWGRQKKRKFAIGCGSIIFVLAATIGGFVLYIESKFAAAAGGSTPPPVPTPLPPTPGSPKCVSSITGIEVVWPLPKPTDLTDVGNSKSPVLRYEVEHDSGIISTSMKSVWLEHGDSCPDQSEAMKSFCTLPANSANTKKASTSCCVSPRSDPGLTVQSYNFTGR